MISNDLLRKAVRAEYTLLRTPLTVLDEQIVSRYTPRGSRVQTSLARTIGALDALAGRLLTEEPAPPRASRPSEAASSDAATEDAGGPEPLPETEQEQIEELAEDLLEAEQEQTFAGELAEDEELRRVQAELRAKHTVEEHDESS